MFKSHVAQIINKYAIIIAGGLDNGIKVGDEFFVVQEGNEIIDKSNGNSLGIYTQKNSKVEVTEVHEKFCIAKHLRRSSLVSDIMINKNFSTTTNESELPVDINEISSIETIKFDKKIHVGDSVIKIN